MATKKRPVFRWLFNWLAAMSLALCIATAYVWGRSRYLGDYLIRVSDGKLPYNVTVSQFGSTAGTLCVFVDQRGNPWHEKGWSHAVFVAYDQKSFAIERGSNSLAVTFPHWVAALVFAILPALWFIQYRRHSRILPGHCATCGYDLRATPDRCPECGEEVHSPKPEKH